MIGEIYFAKEYYSKAYSFLLRGNEISKCIEALKHVMKSGYSGEQDLFVFRLCCEILIRNYKNKQAAIDKV
jgi:nitrogen regulatory protein PII